MPVLSNSKQPASQRVLVSDKPERLRIQMSDEDKVREEILRRTAEAELLTGYSFYGLRKAIRDDGAIMTARRLIDPKGDTKFQMGMRELKRAGLLQLSVEQIIVYFGERGEIFSVDEVEAAKERLAMAELVL